jgi:phospholipase/carboxylesterase
MSEQQHELSLYHLVRQPGEKTEGKPPLLILLHGVGSHERDLFGLVTVLDPRFLILSARAPLQLPNGGFGWYPVNFTEKGPVIDPDAVKQGQAKLTAFINEAKTAYDVERVYLMGFSQGAIMSVNTLLTEPELITGVVAMSGRLLPALSSTWVTDPKRLEKFPITVAHGTEDPVLPVSDGRALRDHLQSLPVSVTYKEYRMAHQISDASLTDIQTWLKGQLDGS